MPASRSSGRTRPRGHDLEDPRAHRVHQRGHHARAGRHHLDRHAVRRGRVPRPARRSSSPATGSGSRSAASAASTTPSWPRRSQRPDDRPGPVHGRGTRGRLGPGDDARPREDEGRGRRGVPRGPRPVAGPRGAAHPGRGGQPVRHGPPHLPLGRLGRGPAGRRPAPDLRPRDGRPRRGPRRRPARPAGDPARHARGRRDPPRRRQLLPVPDRPRARLRQPADPRRGHRRRLRRVRRAAGPQRLAVAGAHARDRRDPGADGQRGPRRVHGGDRRPDGRRDSAAARSGSWPSRSPTWPAPPASSRPTSTPNGWRWPGGWARTRPSMRARTWSPACARPPAAWASTSCSR